MSERKVCHISQQDVGEQAPPKWDRKPREKTGGGKKTNAQGRPRERQEEGEDTSKKALCLRQRWCTKIGSVCSEQAAMLRSTILTTFAAMVPFFFLT